MRLDRTRTEVEAPSLLRGVEPSWPDGWQELCTLKQAELAAEMMLQRWPKLLTVVITFRAGHLLRERADGGWLSSFKFATPPVVGDVPPPQRRSGRRLVQEESSAGRSSGYEELRRPSIGLYDEPRRSSGLYDESRRSSGYEETTGRRSAFDEPHFLPQNGGTHLVLPRQAYSFEDSIGAADAFIGAFVASDLEAKAKGEDDGARSAIALLHAHACGVRSTLLGGARAALPNASELDKFIQGRDSYDRPFAGEVSAACGCKVDDERRREAALPVLPAGSVEYEEAAHVLHLVALRGQFAQVRLAAHAAHAAHARDTDARDGRDRRAARCPPAAAASTPTAERVNCGGDGSWPLPSKTVEASWRPPRDPRWPHAESPRVTRGSGACQSAVTSLNARVLRAPTWCLYLVAKTSCAASQRRRTPQRRRTEDAAARMLRAALEVQFERICC